MSFAVIHKTTRVIRRVTTDAAHVVADDETLQGLGNVSIDLDRSGSATGYWKLSADGTKREEASTQEVSDAAVDPAVEGAKRLTKRRALKVIVNNMTNIEDNISTADLAKLVRNFAKAFKANGG